MEVEIPNRDNRLKPGMYARVLLTIEERKDTTLVPEDRRSSTSKASAACWMPDGDNKAQVPRRSSSVSRTPDRVEILEGLKAGDRIVTEGAASLRSNDTLVLPGQGGPAVPVRRRRRWRSRAAGRRRAAGGQPGQQPRVPRPVRRPPGGAASTAAVAVRASDPNS